LFLAGVAMALLVWCVLKLFPSDEEKIRRRLDRLAQVASFKSDEPPLSKLGNASETAGFFSKDVVFKLNVADGVGHDIKGRETLLQLIMTSRQSLSSLKLEFLDMEVEVAADKTEAVSRFTIRATVSNEPDLQIQQVKLNLIKLDGKWFINRLETVRLRSL